MAGGTCQPCKEVRVLKRYRHGERLDGDESHLCVLCCIFPSFLSFILFFFVPAALFDQFNRKQCTDALFMDSTKSTFQLFFH